MSRIARALAASTAVVATAGLVATGLAPATANATASTAAAKAARLTPTAFALRSSGFATSITGGSIPASSGATALAVIGCTNKAGIQRGNDLASTTIPGLGTVSGTKTRTWTSKTAGSVSVTTQHKVAEVVLSDTPLGKLSISAVTTTAKAWHDASGFHAQTNTDLGGLVYTPNGGDPQELELPLPGQPITIPNVATVSLSSTYTRKTSTSARAFANGLLVDLKATGTKVRVAHAAAEIFSGVRHGIFAGSAYGVTGSLGGDTVKLGRNALLRMPCQGTAGKVRTSALAGIDLADQIEVGALSNSEMGLQGARKSRGWTRSAVADISLPGGLKIGGVVARAAVSRVGNKVARSFAGSSVGAITVNGERQELPLDQVLEIPGVAKLDPIVVQKSSTGLKVIGLRVTLLDGSGAVLDLATARLRIGRSGN